MFVFFWSFLKLAKTFVIFITDYLSESFLIFDFISSVLSTFYDTLAYLFPAELWNFVGLALVILILMRIFKVQP